MSIVLLERVLGKRLMPYLTVKTYNELRKYIKAFSRKNIGLLIVVSRAGLGKTSITEEELEIEAPLIFNSHITPLSFYQILAERTEEEKDCLIVVDEAEMLFRDAKIKTMLKILCDTRKEKVVKYMSTTPLLKGLPKEIHTEAKIIMLINTLNPSDEDIKAIMSRGHLIKFEPSDNEIMNYLMNSAWANDREIEGFIKGFSNLSRSLSLRTYVKAVESKKSCLDWEAEVINELELDPRLLVIKRIIKNHRNENDRIAEWERQTGSSRATYFRYKKIYNNKVLGKPVKDDIVPQNFMSS